MTSYQLQTYLDQITLPQSHSHKGQNGKVMVIGGSELFHAASQWALLVVSRMVDMVFYSSIPSNNQLVQDAKAHFPNGIVIPRTEIENYINEADVVLIGPGMERRLENGEWRTKSGENRKKEEEVKSLTTHNSQLTTTEWNTDTQKVVNYLLAKYPQKKWVIDAGALQMVDPMLLNERCIITPHQKEWEGLLGKVATLQGYKASELQKNISRPFEIPDYFPKVTGIIKGMEDIVFSAILSPKTHLPAPHRVGQAGNPQLITISGGNSGMTKGGTGDVLAGLVAGLYAFTDSPLAAAVVGSWINKAAGDHLYEKVGPFFNATDLANQIPQELQRVFSSKSL